MKSIKINNKEVILVANNNDFLQAVELTKGYKIERKVSANIDVKTADAVKLTLTKSSQKQSCDFALKPKHGGKGVQTFNKEIGNYKGNFTSNI